MEFYRTTRSIVKIEQTTQSGEGFTVRIRGNVGIERHLRVEFDSPPAHLIFRSRQIGKVSRL